MTVYEVCNMYVNPYEEMCIYNYDVEKNVFEGTFDEAMDSEYADKTVFSFGIEDGKICINI